MKRIWRSKQDILILMFGLLVYAAGLGCYSRMPDSLASHFNLNGDANGYIGKQVYYFIMAIMIFGFPLLFKILRFSYRASDNNQQLDRPYNFVRWSLLAVISIAYWATLGYNLGWNTTFIPKVLFIIIGVIMLVIGNLLPTIRSNGFIGVRTPWTLADSEVWRKTHRFSGYISIFFGIIVITGGFVHKNLISWGVLFISLMGLAVIPTIYSLVLYRKRH